MSYEILARLQDIWIPHGWKINIKKTRKLVTGPIFQVDFPFHPRWHHGSFRFGQGQPRVRGAQGATVVATVAHHAGDRLGSTGRAIQGALGGLTKGRQTSEVRK